MFDFEKRAVYWKAKGFNAGIRSFIKVTRLDNKQTINLEELRLVLF